MSKVFPELVASYLTRGHLESDERSLIAEMLAFGHDGWQAIDQISPPPLLLPSQDPVNLALRRLVAPDPRPLGARHRVALQEARQRPYGFFRLALEEAWLLGLRQAAADEGVVAIVEQLAEQVPGEYPQARADLGAYALLAQAHVQALALNSAWEETWSRAVDATKNGSEDPELQATALEVGAHAATLAGHGIRHNLALANGWWRLALALHADAVGLEPDRLAEIHAGYANFLAARGHHQDSRKHLRAAERRLAEVDASWNEPLRVRLAELSASNPRK